MAALTIQTKEKPAVVNLAQSTGKSADASGTPLSVVAALAGHIAVIDKLVITVGSAISFTVNTTGGELVDSQYLAANTSWTLPQGMSIRGNAVGLAIRITTSGAGNVSFFAQSHYEKAVPDLNLYP